MTYAGLQPQAQLTYRLLTRNGGAAFLNPPTEVGLSHKEQMLTQARLLLLLLLDGI